MGKLFLSMAIGAAVMLATTDNSQTGLKATVHSAALAVAEAVR